MCPDGGRERSKFGGLVRRFPLFTGPTTCPLQQTTLRAHHRSATLCVGHSVVVWPQSADPLHLLDRYQSQRRGARPSTYGGRPGEMRYLPGRQQRCRSVRGKRRGVPNADEEGSEISASVRSDDHAKGRSASRLRGGDGRCGSRGTNGLARRYYYPRWAHDKHRGHR